MPPSIVKNTNTSTPLFVVVNVGAVAATQSTLAGHVIVLALLSCITFKTNDEALPEAAGLLKVVGDVFCQIMFK